VSREQVSPTSFILTVKPKFSRDGGEGEGTTAAGLALSVLFPRLEFPRASHTNRPVLEAAWDHGLWSIEIKQPQLQVARDYTPLPPSSPGEEERDLEQGRLRFFVRKMDGGEVSTYLSRLRIGDTVELRGPHLGFDVRARLGSADRIVFLAGGTGIAPALQTVRAVLEIDGSGSRSPAPNSTKPTVFILWANRHRADCPGVGPPPIAFSSRTETQSTTNAIVSLLAQMEARHGEKLRFAATVDEQNTFISPDDILDAATTTTTNPHPSPDKESTRWLPRWWPRNDRKVRLPLALTSTQPGSSACRYHSATVLASSDGRDPPAAAASIIDACGCASEGIAGGRNLLMVSGPAGFIGAYAGPKRWANGKELQGAVGGAAGALLQAASSGVAQEQGASWMVLKL
jgi:NADPH-dependent ferric siderophore reductase